MKRSSLVWTVVLLLATRATAAAGDDWPMWRHDAARTAVSAESLPRPLHLQWTRHYPALRPAYWQVRQDRLQFDAGYEPVAAGGRLFFGSSRNDSVTALDAKTGRELWRFFAGGPVRFAPVVWREKVYFGSDDGRVYCLGAADGKPIWKRRIAPSSRKVLGNGRLISVWPIRGGLAVADGRVYFAAGVWPFEGVFVGALDAATGHLVWLNDRCGSRYCIHPHGAASFGGPSPQGYLLIRGDELVVPSGRAFPAFFDLRTGAMRNFEFGHQGHGSVPGSWFVATAPDGHMLVDPAINTEIHDAGRQVVGQRGMRPIPGETLQKEVNVGGRAYRVSRGARATITAGGRQLRFDDPPSAVEGAVHTMLAASGRLFVVTREGTFYCFGSEKVVPKTYRTENPAPDRPADAWVKRARQIVEKTGATRGFALVLGLGSGRLAEELIRDTELHVIVVDPDAAKIDAFRKKADAAGWYGDRTAACVANPVDAGLPPYLARLIVSEDLAARLGDGKRFAQISFAALRPYGGSLCLAADDAQHAALVRSCEAAGLDGARPRRESGFSILTREGPLPGARDYVGRPNRDGLVRAPLGLLWFGDTVHHHKLYYRTYDYEIGRGLPQTIQVVAGVMRYEATRSPIGPNPPLVPYRQYLRLLEKTRHYEVACTDVYTGCMLSEAETARQFLPATGVPPAEAEQAGGRIPAGRTNPLTGALEARSLVKTYGCDRYAADYGNMLTLRSGTAAFYDKRTESGTINIGGIRSGCRNSIVPACGVLSLPSWTGNCTCNYPCFTSLALVPMPERFEQWSAWGEVAVEAPVRRVGINLGAPGDRAARDGTLWLDWPSVGGPSPLVPVRVEPARAKPFYRHALWVDGGESQPWIAGSGLQGARSIRIEPVALRRDAPSRAFAIRWAGFLDVESAGAYTFHARSDHGVRMWIDGKMVLNNEPQLRRGAHDEVSGSASLKAGHKHRLLLEYYGAKNRQADQSAAIEWSWSNPATPKAPVPPERLSTVDGRRGGLTAAYYDNPDFAGPAALQTDRQVRFAWPAGARPAVLKRLQRPVHLPQRKFTVRLHFAEPENIGPGERVFSIRLQGKPALRDLDIVKQAGRPRRGIVREFRGVSVKDALQIDLAPSTSKPAVLGGVELIAEDAGD